MTLSLASDFKLKQRPFSEQQMFFRGTFSLRPGGLIEGLLSMDKYVHGNKHLHGE